MKRLLRLGAPTLGTVLLRLAQLTVLLAFARLTDGETQHFLVTGFGVLASFAIISDAGGAPFLLSLRPERHSLQTFGRVVALQGGFALLGPVAFFGFAILIAPDGIATPHFFVLIALSLAQAFDTMGRTAKSPWLVQRRDHLFAFPDILNGLFKMALVGLALVVGSVDLVAAVALVSVVAFVATFLVVRRGLPEQTEREPKLVRRVLEIGVTGMLSSAYSQTPMLFAAGMLPLEVSAVFAVTYRIVQALELLPATATVQLIPRFRALDARRVWLLFTGAGVLLAIVLILAWPIVTEVFTIEVPLDYLVPIALAFALKCGNYSVVAYLLSSERVRQRLVVTVLTGIFAVILVPSLILAAGPRGLALSAPIIEIVFLATTIIVLRTPLRPLRRKGSE
ncbi:lipopolysaccharide biosynthesis protein [Microbacterium foliorum]|uniref:lipopolysaccharide biosynthesis protein n=1 Tax=Microbacterium foliorum TaxID=104336 RepID=UPI001D6028D4|nr:hypothetical protein [Microbacterium foliorum]CAH0146494.1 hypothetical protein SRABI44_00603 [Microbacterium foliorum]CAH0147985.1 hypothetical protein SRABI03_00686 [Microbacterium foliorum]